MNCEGAGTDGIFLDVPKWFLERKMEEYNTYKINDMK